MPAPNTMTISRISWQRIIEVVALWENFVMTASIASEPRDVCMYVCIVVFMYVCMYVWYVYVCMYVCMYACMYVCVCMNV